MTKKKKRKRGKLCDREEKNVAAAGTLLAKSGGHNCLNYSCFESFTQKAPVAGILNSFKRKYCR